MHLAWGRCLREFRPHAPMYFFRCAEFKSVFSGEMGFCFRKAPALSLGFAMQNIETAANNQGRTRDNPSIGQIIPDEVPEQRCPD